MSVRPRLVLVTGAPGSGKTTLAARLAGTLGWVRLSRDEFKERLWDAWTEQPTLRAQVPVAHWGAYYAGLHALLDAGVNVVAEGSVHHTAGVPEVRALLDRADVNIIHCTAPREIAHARFRARAQSERHPAHRDADLMADLEENPGRWAHFEEPVDVGVPVLRVDTSQGTPPDLNRLAAFIGVA